MFGKLGSQGTIEADDMHVSIQSLTRTEILTVENANVTGDGV